MVPRLLVLVHFVVLAALAVAPVAASRHQQRIELPGAPVALIPCDLDRDANRDLLVVVAAVDWGEEATTERVAMDEVEGLVEVMTVVPAIIARREVRAFLGTPDGFVAFGLPLELPPQVVVVEGAEPIAPALAIGGDGVSAIRWTGAGLELESLLEVATAFTGVSDLLPELGLVRDVDGDTVPDLLLPRERDLAIYRGEAGRLGDEPAALLVDVGEQRSSSARIVSRRPLPEVGDLDGDRIPDLLFRDPLEDWKLVRIARGLGEARFAPASSLATDPAEGAPVWVGDLDGDGHGEVVIEIQQEEGEDAGLRESLAEAREPHSTLIVHRLTDLSNVGAERGRYEVAGFVLGRGSIPLPGGLFDLDDDGRQDLAALTTDIGVGKALAALATKRITLEIGVNLWCNGPGGWRRVLPLDLSGSLKVDLSDIQIRRLAFFAGDLDGDGRTDFLELGKDAVARVRRGGEGCRYPSGADLQIPLLAAPADPLLTRVLDLDHDGADDLAVIQPARAREPGVSPTVGLELALSGGPRAAVRPPRPPNRPSAYASADAARSGSPAGSAAATADRAAEGAAESDPPQGVPPVAAPVVAGPGRLALAHPLVGAVGVLRGGRPGTAIAEGGKDLPGRVRWVPASGGEAMVLAEGLVGLDSLVGIDADGDGRNEVLLAGYPGGIWAIGETGAELVVSQPGVDLRSARPSAAAAEGTVVLLQAGRLDRRRWSGGRLELHGSTPAPLSLDREPWGLVLESPLAWVAGDRVALGPIDRSAARVETVVVDSAGTVASAWSLLPSPFHTERSQILALGGTPVLVTFGAETIGILVDSDLLVHSLVPDPSRGGFRPLARLETPCALWEGGVAAARSTGDSEDLIVACPKGIAGGELWVGAWRVGVGGRPTNRREVDLVDDPSAWRVGPDLDGDGIGDAAVIDREGVLTIHRGRESGRPFDKRPLREETLGRASGERRVEVSVGTAGTSARDAGASRYALEIASGDGAPPRVVAARMDGESGGEVLVISF